MVLRKILGAKAALVEAMFYLAYAGKHETITWISAGAYLVIRAALAGAADLPGRTLASYVGDGDYRPIPLGTLGPGSQSPVGKEAP